MTKETFDDLHRLIKRGDLIAVRHVLGEGLSPNFENKFGWTMLMLAASEGNTAIGELLISSGADTNRATNTGQTALSLAILGGHIGFLKMLLTHGAHPNTIGAVEKWLPAFRLKTSTEQAIFEEIRRYRDRNSS
ncbi:MAG TPA: ankyrin repeat domain-containing protein [Rhizomicrobium sp.]|jgi:ankyrin repeat protein